MDILEIDALQAYELYIEYRTYHEPIRDGYREDFSPVYYQVYQCPGKLVSPLEGQESRTVSSLSSGSYRKTYILE